MKTRKEIKNQAKKMIKDNMWSIFIIFTIFILLEYLIAIIPDFIGVNRFVTNSNIIIGGEIYKITELTVFGFIWEFIMSLIASVFWFGIVYYVFNIVNGSKKTILDIFKAIGKKFFTVFLVSLIYNACISVGSMLFIIPGIVLALGWILKSCIMVDHPEMKSIDVLKTSWNMMKRHKTEVFIYGLSFIGWGLLCVLIIPLIYVIPYILITYVLYYNELKKEYVK